jgi:hypothetical protein
MMQNKNYKRQTRQMPERTKQLISQKLKGRKKSPQHIERISMGMKKAWSQIGQNSPDAPNQDGLM